LTQRAAAVVGAGAGLFLAWKMGLLTKLLGCCGRSLLSACCSCGSSSSNRKDTRHSSRGAANNTPRHWKREQHRGTDPGSSSDGGSSPRSSTYLLQEPPPVSRQYSPDRSGSGSDRGYSPYLRYSPVPPYSPHHSPGRGGPSPDGRQPHGDSRNGHGHNSSSLHRGGATAMHAQSPSAYTEQCSHLEASGPHSPRWGEREGYSTSNPLLCQRPASGYGQSGCSPAQSYSPSYSPSWARGPGQAESPGRADYELHPTAGPEGGSREAHWQVQREHGGALEAGQKARPGDQQQSPRRQQRPPRSQTAMMPQGPANWN